MFVKINGEPLKLWQNEKCLIMGNEAFLELSRVLKSPELVTNSVRDVVRRKSPE